MSRADEPALDLALSTEPPASLDARLRSLAASLRPEVVVVRGDGGGWADTPVAGLQRKTLLRDASDRRQTALARYAPGALHPAHRHADVEEVYVLEGDAVVQGRAMAAGDFCAAEAGTVHRAVSSRGGALVLVSHSLKDAPTAQPDAGERGIVFALARDAAWREASPGVRVRWLYRDAARDLGTAVVTLAPGATVRGGGWQVYVLRGAVTLAGCPLGAGDFRYDAGDGALQAEAPSEVLVVDAPAGWTP